MFDLLVQVAFNLSDFFSFRLANFSGCMSVSAKSQRSLRKVSGKSQELNLNEPLKKNPENAMATPRFQTLGELLDWLLGWLLGWLSGGLLGRLSGWLLGWLLATLD